MLGTPAFYNRTIEKMTNIVGSIFSDIYVQRFKQDNVTVDKLIKVPVDYAPREPYLVRAKDNPDLKRPINQTLPAIAYQLMTMEPDPNRQMSPVNMIIAPTVSDPTQKVQIMQPIAYNFKYEVYVKANRASDAFQIVEQILPFFRTNLTASVYLLDNVDLALDVNVFLENIGIEDNYEGQLDKLRTIIWTIPVTVQGWIFGPANTQAKFIKKVQVDLHASMLVPGTRASRVVVTPGLTSDGQPTTDSADSISYQSINFNDPYGICVDLTDYDDGKYFDPSTNTDIGP